MLSKAKLTLAILAALSIFVAVVAATAEAGNRGMVVVATGGGSIDEALFASGNAGDATFSLHVGYDKHGELKGHFFLKRVYPGAGVRAVVSTEITHFELGFDVCPWVRMEGRMTLHATWVNKPIRGEYFAVEAWDCEGIDDVPDMIWFGIYRTEEVDSARSALTLSDPTELANGNIMIR
ncbi:MAG: hypothetical protein N2F24_19690 [Deltaproteobacteria bacterium]